jgi:hypothetical protein
MSTLVFKTPACDVHRGTAFSTPSSASQFAHLCDDCARLTLAEIHKSPVHPPDGKWMVDLAIVEPDGRRAGGTQLFLDSFDECMKILTWMIEFGGKVKQEARVRDP